MKRRYFRIGDFCFSVSYPEQMRLPDHLALFSVPENRNMQYSYRILLSGCLPQPEGTIAAQREDIRVFYTENKEVRILSLAGDYRPYACCREIDDDHSEIIADPLYLSVLKNDTMFISLLSLEKRMIHQEALILHCAYLDTGDGAVLFSAPSGTGKSTQAMLWEKYRPGSVQINGDRALLQKVNGAWTARSWPVCGSSEICRLQDTRIRAVVMLSQEKENVCRKLCGAAAFAEIYPQITCNRWDKQLTIHTMDLIEDLIGSVPVYHLGCTICEEAVDVLEWSLKEGEAHE